MNSIVLLGEAPGKAEEREGKPFVGPAGKMLNQMLAAAGINRLVCHLTNVFDQRPPDTDRKSNDLGQWCCGKKEALELLKRDGGSYCMDPAEWEPWIGAPIASATYIKPEYGVPALIRLRDELETIKPNIVVCLGNTALWAMTHSSGIMKQRGAVAWSSLVNCKILPTFHPAMFLYEEDRGISKRAGTGYYAVGILDLFKAKRQSEHPELHTPNRTIEINPDPQYLAGWVRRECANSGRVAIDIETGNGEIECASVAWSRSDIVVLDMQLTGDRRVAYRCFLKDILEDPDIEKLGQNFVYDVQWLERELDCRVENWAHDTMALHHALQPELPKALGFLGSLYTEERAWKHQRPSGTSKLIKGEE